MIKKIHWRIVLEGSNFIDVNDTDNEEKLYKQAADRLGDIISHEGLPEWTDMNTEVTSVNDVEKKEDNTKSSRR